MKKLLLLFFCSLFSIVLGCSLFSPSDPLSHTSSQGKIVEKVLQERTQTSSQSAQKKERISEEKKEQQQTEPSNFTNINCAYFYFLSGTQAEYGQRFAEALDAYQKALVCDPESIYIQQKISSLMFQLKQYDEASIWLEKKLQQSPENFFYLQLLAQTYLQQGKVDESIKLYSHILELQPDSENTVSQLAIINFQQGNYQKATDLLENFLQQHTKAYTPHLTLARIYSQQKKLSAAVNAFHKSLEIHWTEQVAGELAFTYSQSKELVKAEEIYQQLEEDGFTDENLAFMLIKIIYFDEERYKMAFDKLEYLRNISEDTTRIDYLQSLILLQQNRHKEADTLLQNLIYTARHNEACYFLAFLAYEKKEFDSSLEYLQLIDKESEEFKESVYLQSQIHERRKAYQQAIDTLVTNFPQNKDRDLRFYTVLASLLQLQEKTQMAQKMLLTGLTYYPDSTELLYQLGLLYEHEGERKLAQDTMEKLIAKQPDHAAALNFLGYSWADNNIKLDQAYAYLQKANALKPDNAFILDSLGWVLYRMGELSQANEMLIKALQLNPDNFLIMEHLGDVNFALECHEAAKKYYNQAYEYAESEEEQKRLKEKIDKLK